MADARDASTTIFEQSFGPIQATEIGIAKAIAG